MQTSQRPKASQSTGIKKEQAPWRPEGSEYDQTQKSDCYGGPPGKSWQSWFLLRARSGPSRQHGFTFSELLVSLCLMGLLVTVTVPAIGKLHRDAALGSLSRKLSCLMMQCRARAVMQRRSIGLVFEQDDNLKWRCFLAEDGDGDGILRSDLNRGRDRKLSEVYGLTRGGAGLGILAVQRIPDPSGRGRLGGNMNDPVRAGRGDIITFTQEGTATPCSVYLTDNHSTMRVIRVYGGTGKIHMFKWQVGWPRWQRPKT
jgi:type II secretory pathway pseudopilin PulG